VGNKGVLLTLRREEKKGGRRVFPFLGVNRRGRSGLFTEEKRGGREARVEERKREGSFEGKREVEFIPPKEKEGRRNRDLLNKGGERKRSPRSRIKGGRASS